MMKKINSQMKQFKKQKGQQSNQNRYVHSQDGKQNMSIQQFQEKQFQRKNSKRYIQQAEKLIMNQRLKEIVANNVQYFRNIRKHNFLYLLVQVKQTYKPNAHSLKLPSKMVSTLYKSDFLRKKQYDTHNIPFQMHKIDQVKSQNTSQSKVPAKTTYQVNFNLKKNQFQKFKEVELTLKEKSKTSKQGLNKRSVINDAPSFLDTHNNLQYRNWGTGSVMPSMKPSPKVATTDMPFKANSMYRTQFHNVILPKTQLVVHEETFPQSIDLWMGKTSYGKDFSKKKNKGPQITYKPIQNPGATNLPFNSTTQYKGSYIESLVGSNANPTKKWKNSSNKISNEDIQKLVLDL